MRIIAQLSITLLFTFFSAKYGSAATNQLPTSGIYDGYIGKHKLILVIDSLNANAAIGYYIYNRKNSVEEKHAIRFQSIRNQPEIISSDFQGNFIGNIQASEISGKLKNKQFSLFFWENSSKFKFTRRTVFQLADLNRYKQEIFEEVSVQQNINYGEAVGHWTETPYIDDPYIEILANGMVNLLKREKKLDLTLDLYQPEGDKNQLRPMVLLIHGGGFYIGNKASSTERIMATKLAKMGYVVASMNYRLGFRLNGKEIERSGYKALQDAHAALRFLSGKSHKLRIDPNQVYLAGTSAGAIAALNIAFLDNDERPESSYADRKRKNLGNIETSGNTLNNTFNVKAVCNLWGAVSDTSILDSDERIPVLSYHGDRDDIVPIDHSHPFKNTLRLNRLIMDEVYGSLPIHERLDHLGIENKLFVLYGKGHEPQLDNFKEVNALLYDIIDEMKTFFYKITSLMEFESDTIQISVKQKLKPVNIALKEGKARYIEVSGGLKVSNNPKEKRVIWLKEATEHEIKLYAQNKFAAWSEHALAVQLIE